MPLAEISSMRSSMPVYTVAETRAIEQSASAGLPAGTLMARAGLAAAELARELLGERGRAVLVLAGLGNNGGDAFEAAAHLRQWFFRVSVVFTGTMERLPADARAALGKWRAAGGDIADTIPADFRADLVIDGLFGIGLARPIGGPDAELIEAVNRYGKPILALDIPSGISGDTGQSLGSAIRATTTLTFLTMKPGLLTLDGPDHCGELCCDQLGVDIAAFVPAGTPTGWFVGRPLAGDFPIKRPSNFHKGHAGSVVIFGGADGMTGAALLAGRAALRVGAGKVFVGMLDEHALCIDPNQPELMLRPATQLVAVARREADAIAVGPGLGTSLPAYELLKAILAIGVPLILDADALNLIAAHSDLAASVVQRRAQTLITPHPAEAARLLATTTESVQADRLAAARSLASRYNAIAVLKGNGSITATPPGDYWINGSGNPGMAAAGMGDVLTGFIASLVTQYRDSARDPAAATRFGVWLHGAAADTCVQRGIGPIGLTASDVIDAARTVINHPHKQIS